MIKMFKENLIDAFKTIYPILMIVVFLTTFIPITIDLLLAFLLSIILLIVGTAMFTFGAELSLIDVGKKIGNRIIKSKRLWIIFFVTFILGTILTIAEPDLRVLADQVVSIPSNFIIIIISVGVGVYMVIAALRSILGLNLNWILLISYIIIFGILFFVPSDFIPFAFDSGSVTTGTISIPFIITMGVGLVATRADKKAKEDSFGLIALCSTGPILMILVIGILFKVDTSYSVNDLVNTSFNLNTYLSQFNTALKDTLFSITPIIIVFLIYQLLFKEVNKKELLKIFLGLIFVFLGLILFLISVNIGFMDIAIKIGQFIALSKFKYLLIPLIMILAYFIAIAEPAVVVLINQVDKLTGGSITKNELKISLAIGVSISAGLNILRVFTHTNFLYYALPCYIIAVVLMFFIPKYITAVAFDAGGATGGTLTATFLLPIATGACASLGGNILTDAFGMAAFTSIIPIITVEFIGVLYNIRLKSKKKLKKLDDSIIDFTCEACV